MDLSQIKFPDYVTGIKRNNGEWLKGGYDYQTQRPSGGWCRYFYIRQYIEFSGDMLSGSVPTTGTYVSDPFTVYTFPNGYKMKVTFTQVSGYSSNDLSVIGNLYDLNDNVVGDISNIYKAYHSITLHYPTERGNINTHDFKICVFLNTVYYPDANPSAGTSNHGLFLNLTCGFSSYDFHIIEGSNYSISGAIEVMELGQFYNLDGFTNYLHSNGNPFTGNVFTDDPLPDDPAGSHDNSVPGGGEGNYDDTSDPIDFPALPTGGALECGAVYAHHVSVTTIESIVSKLWTNSIFDPVSMWQKSLDNPFDAIVSLHALPIVPSEASDSNPLYIGNFNTGLAPIPKVTSQYKEIDCGSLDIKEYWGSALDYSPYTRAEIFLPFIGVKDVAIEDIMNSTIHIKYHVDILTGDCIAFIKCGMSVLYHFNGNCRMTVPLSAQTTDALQNAVGETGKLLSTAAIGGAVGGAPGALAGATISAAANVASSKIRTNKGGDVSGSVSLMDDFTPYVIIHRPVQSLAKDYNKFKGYPSNITSLLGNLIGYTEVEHIHLEGISNATEAEMNEIVSLLKQGVII